MNITRKEKENYSLFPDQLTTETEKDLYNCWQQIAGKIDNNLDRDDYDQALSTVAELKISIDTFFNEVMVMVDEKEIRENRLALLQGIAGDFKKIADFAKL